MCVCRGVGGGGGGVGRRVVEDEGEVRSCMVAWARLRTLLCLTLTCSVGCLEGHIRLEKEDKEVRDGMMEESSRVNKPFMSSHISSGLVRLVGEGMRFVGDERTTWRVFKHNVAYLTDAAGESFRGT